MRRFEVIFGAEAEADLLQIYRRVYDASRDPNIAGRFLDRLSAVVSASAMRPMAGARALIWSPT